MTPSSAPAPDPDRTPGVASPVTDTGDRTADKGASPAQLVRLSEGEREAMERTTAEVEGFLAATRGAWRPGQDGYFGRLALMEALAATADLNYGVGAVAVKVTRDEVRVYSGRNSMVSGNVELLQHFGPDFARVLTLIGHAEPVAVVKSMLEASIPYESHARTATPELAAMREGLHVFTTLEPCPMCTSIITNAPESARVVSNALDELGAYVVRDRQTRQPPIWTGIQDRKGLVFETLEVVAGDPPRPGIDAGEVENLATLTRLSNEIFLNTRVPIDAYLAASLDKK